MCCNLSPPPKLNLNIWCLLITSGACSSSPSSPHPRYYALLGERFCKLKREYADCFAEAFVRQYQLIHRCALVWIQYVCTPL